MHVRVYIIIIIILYSGASEKGHFLTGHFVHFEERFIPPPRSSTPPSHLYTVDNAALIDETVKSV